MLRSYGGVFGRNPTFNTVTVSGAMTAGGNITLGSGANLVVASGQGISFAATSDPTIAAVAATGVITRTATNVSNNDTVTVGTTVYTFKTTLTPADYEVKIGADSGLSLVNLSRAINNSGGTPGTDYQVPAANAFATADTASVSGGFPLGLTAIAAGSAGNSITLATSAAQLSVSAATLRGGADAGGMTSELLSDYEEGTWTPGLSGGGITGPVFGVRLGRYTKIGRIVHVTAHLALIDYVNVTGAPYVAITGLPYASANVTSMQPTGSLLCQNLQNGTNGNIPLPYLGEGFTSVNLIDCNSNGWPDPNSLFVGNRLTRTAALRLSMTYAAS